MITQSNIRNAVLKALINIATSIDRSFAESKSLRIAKYLTNCLMWSLCVVSLLTGGLYIYEQTIRMEDVVDIRATLATKSEYENGESIKFVVIGNITDDSHNSVSMNTILRCDDGYNGAAFVSSHKTEITNEQIISNPDILELLDSYIPPATLTQTYTAISDSIRLITNSLSVDTSSVLYEGSVPADIRTCVGEHVFVAKTPIFGIELVSKQQSYPFDYVWYDDNNISR